MEGAGLYLTLGGIGTILGLISAAGGIWRFLIKPALDASAREQAETSKWRRNAETRLVLLEHAAPPELKTDLRRIREDLVNG